MRVAGRIVVLLVVLGAGDAARAKGIECPDGAYRITVVGRRARLAVGQTIELASRTVSLPAVCPPVAAEPDPYASAADWFGSVRARWDECVPGSPVRAIRARFDHSCTELAGALRLGRGRRARVRAIRVPVCGDGIVQADEECDHPADPCCTEECRADPGCSGPCLADAECAAAAYCHWGATCGAAHGECRVRAPGACAVGAVCGCDGMTYADWCAASAAGTPIEYFGACGTRCVLGNERLACADGFFCDVPGWRCDQKRPGAWGECVAVPEDPVACVPYNPVPICGCDGVVYANDCHRRAARVQWEACEP